jgi:hypothetical protein
MEGKLRYEVYFPRMPLGFGEGLQPFSLDSKFCFSAETNFPLPTYILKKEGNTE